MKLTKEMLTEMVKEVIKEQIVEGQRNLPGEEYSGHITPTKIQKATILMKKAEKLCQSYYEDIGEESWAVEEILNHLRETIDRAEKYYGKK